MSCNSNTPYSYNVQYFQQGCGGTDPVCGNNVGNAKCVFYTAAALPCTGIETNDSLEVALQKIEEKVCQTTGDYSTYNVACLAPISTQQEFVEKISSEFCALQTDYETFVNTTFPAYQTSVTNSFSSVSNPNITCSVAGVTPSDNMVSVLNKYCTTLNNLNSFVSLSGVNWSQCFSVPVPPVNIAAAFNLINSQICTLANSGAALPTFNNVGSCLSSPTANDSLTDTIVKIRTRLCQTGTFDINALNWGCVSKPSSTTTDLQSAIQAILTNIDDYIKNKLTFSADFQVTQTDGGNACLGKTVSLTTPIVGTDRLVAANNADNSPGTLINKVVSANTDCVIDDTTTPGKVTFTNKNDKVKAGAGDSSNGYLIDKIDGKTNSIDGLVITEAYNAATDKVDLTPSANWNVLINKMFDEIQADAVLKSRFCEIVASCNIFPSSSTTTTTSTTAAPLTYTYLADRYLCGTCTLDVTDQIVDGSPVGPLTGNRFYYGADGYLYYIKSVQAGVPVTTIFLSTNYASCASMPCP